MRATRDRLARLLNLVPWVLTHPGTRVADIAAEFGITEDEVRADLDLVFLCGQPGHLPDDLIDVVYEGDRVTVANADAIGRPLRLSPEEALALIVALRAVAELPGVRERGAVERALAKLETAAGTALEVASRVAVAAEEPELALYQARDALDRGRLVHLRYYVPGRDETTERDVDPIRLVQAGGRWYLEGWCRRAEALRLFRLDRVFDLRILDTAAQPPQQASARDFDDGLFSPSADDEQVVLELAPQARWVIDYYPCDQVDELADGRLLVRLRSRERGWLRRLALRLGDAARIADPPDLAEEVRAEAAAALAGYPESEPRAS
ncbi:MAG TPA: WYL domain-containing protein [Mycobacteriales bacterium]|nr:WYL domain-containing protein [Mycobacteriales bacterium]